tara:strand:- start:1564 stop:2388 length:825 start_codon:yes stop_codon:yes gene_type:complete
MSLIRTTDAATFSNNVGVTNGDATVTKNAADAIVQGDVIVLDNVNYIVRSVSSTTSIELHKVYAGATEAALAGAVRRTPPFDAAKYVVKGGDSNVGELLFVDATEVGLAENKQRGLKGPGWWNYKTYTDASGNTRHKAVHLAYVYVAAGTSGDYSDDTNVADAASSVTITVNPASSTSSSGAGTFANLTETSTGSPGSLIYTWQRQKAGTKRWTNITASLDTGITYVNFTSAILGYNSLASDALDGYKYRVKLTSTGGTEEVISDGAATLTFGS